jgi:hypothetical protein
MTQMPCSCKSRSARAKLTTCTNGTISAAPHATLRTVAFKPTARSAGAMHRMNTRRCRAAQTCAQIVRVLHPVQHQQQSRPGRRRQQSRKSFSSSVPAPDHQPGSDALMARAAAQPIQFRSVGVMDRHTKRPIACSSNACKPPIPSLALHPQSRNCSGSFFSAAATACKP